VQDGGVAGVCPAARVEVAEGGGVGDDEARVQGGGVGPRHQSVALHGLAARAVAHHDLAQRAEQHTQPRSHAAQRYNTQPSTGRWWVVPAG
jgi:hypothetical protein